MRYCSKILIMEYIQIHFQVYAEVCIKVKINIVIEMTICILEIAFYQAM